MAATKFVNLWPIYLPQIKSANQRLIYIDGGDKICEFVATAKELVL